MLLFCTDQAMKNHLVVFAFLCLICYGSLVPINHKLLTYKSIFKKIGALESSTGCTVCKGLVEVLHGIGSTGIGKGELVDIVTKICLYYIPFNFSDMNVLKSGFQKLWETIVEKEKINVTFNVDILQVVRPKNYWCAKPSASPCRDDVWIAQRIGNSAAPTWENYDFLIWSPEMKDSIHRWRNPEPKEVEYFSKTEHRYFTTSLIDTENMKRGLTPIDYWVDNMSRKRENSVWAQRDSYGVLQKQAGPEYMSSVLPTSDNKADKRRTTVVYQMGRRLSSERYLTKLLHKHLKRVDADITSVIDVQTWRYFPRYSPEEMERGILWRILEMQGRHGMWYIGSSVCFESVKSVVEYNRLIVENMKPVQ